MTWRDFSPFRTTIWPPLACGLLVWLAWQLFHVVPQRERADAAQVVAVLSRARTALLTARAAEQAARDSAAVLRRQRDSILAAVPVARPVVRRQLTLVSPTAPDTLLRRVVAERDTARSDVELLAADTTQLRETIRALAQNAAAADVVESGRAAVVLPALDTASAQIQTAAAAVRPPWHVRSLRFLGQRGRDVALVGLGMALQGLR